MPKNWVTTTLQDILSVLESGKRPKGGVSQYLNGIPSIGAEHLSPDGNFDFTNIKYVPPEFAKSMARGIINKSDILVVKDGATTGKTSYVNNAFPFSFCVINEHVFICRTVSLLVAKYVFYVLWCATGKNKILLDFRGAAQGGISTSFPSKVIIPLPPLPEQHRIVAKIEELFSDLDAGIAALKKAKDQLKTYRQSVLKWAFEGKLTNKNVNERELPEGWKWIYTKELFEYVTSGSRGWAQYYSDEGAVFLRMGNLDHDSIELDLSDIQYVKLPNKAEGTRSIVQEGDILISITADVGMIALVPVNFPEAYINQHVALARPYKKLVQPSYLAWYLASKENGQKQLRDLQRGATKVGLGLDDIRSVKVPIPSLIEQQTIVEQIESRLSLSDNLEKTIDESLSKATALRQSILKRAFEGKLVPQDPNDEPAEKLLERIKGEKRLNHDSCDSHDCHDSENQSNQKNHKNHGSDNVFGGNKNERIHSRLRRS